jgi:putative salt-induced outer membrane protein
MRTTIGRTALILLIALGASPAFAQAPAAAPADTPPPPPWTGSFGAGLSLTRGNSDTTNVNLSFDSKYDPKNGYLFKAEGLYLRGRTEGQDTANRLFLQGRAERTFTPRTFFFAQLQYVRDTFKAIDYLVAPTAGIGYKVVDTPATQFTVDTSIGLVAEKNPGIDVKRSVAWLASEKLSHKLSDTATLTHSAQALWKMEDLTDGLYTVSVGVAATLTARSQLKAELLDTLKGDPPLNTKTNDVALLVSVVFKY